MNKSILFGENMSLTNEEKIENIRKAKIFLSTVKYRKELATHGGVFHADDVFSTALIRLLYDVSGYGNMHVYRTKNAEDLVVYKKITGDVLTYDIGCGRYDHHQEDVEIRENGVKYASFGLLFRDFVDTESHFYTSFDANFVEKIDDNDNGGEFFIVSQMVRDMNPTYGASTEAYNDGFYNAVLWAYEYLINHFNQIATKSDEFIVPQIEKNSKILLFDNGEKAILVLNSYIPWKRYAGIHFYYSVLKNIWDWDWVRELEKHEECRFDMFQSIRYGCSSYAHTPQIVACIYPSQRGGYASEAYPKPKNIDGPDFKFRTDLSDENKSEYGCYFIHNSGFLAGFDTYEGAVEGTIKWVYQTN